MKLIKDKISRAIRESIDEMGLVWNSAVHTMPHSGSSRTVDQNSRQQFVEMVGNMAEFLRDEKNHGFGRLGVNQYLLSSLKKTISEIMSQQHAIANESVGHDKAFKFKVNDVVIVKSKKYGDFKGIVKDYDYNIMTWKKEYCVETPENGWRCIDVPEEAMRLADGSDK